MTDHFPSRDTPLTDPLAAAFPAEIREDVSRVSALIQPDADYHRGVSVRVRGQALILPYRIEHGFDEALFPQLNATQAVIYACVLSRHLDGKLRQRQIARLALAEQAWPLPFVVQLCGEYVMQILETVEAHLPAMNPRRYGGFLRDNAAFLDRAEQRMISYWDCYYRRRYPIRSDYVGFRVFERFRAWQAAED